MGHRIGATLGVPAIAVMLACGGQSASRAVGGGNGDDAKAGAAALPAGEGGDGDAATSGDGGAATAGAGFGASAAQNNAGETSEAGAPAVIRPHDDSGVRFCEVPQECGELECRGWRQFGHLVCVSSCPNGNECGAKEACLVATDLEASCFAVCDSPSQCAYAFDCYDWYGNGTYACIPAEWVR